MNSTPVISFIAHSPVTRMQEDQLIELRDRVLVRVRSGMDITQALKNDDRRSYYNSLSRAQRAPVNQARREYLATTRPPAESREVMLKVKLSSQRRGLFDRHCVGLGTSMNRRINSLIIADMKITDDANTTQREINRIRTTLDNLRAERAEVGRKFSEGHLSSDDYLLSRQRIEQDASKVTREMLGFKGML